MMVLVDTPVWSLALRRQPENLSPEQEHIRDQLQDLIVSGRAVLIGPVRQELLSGIRESAQFQRLRNSLRAFADTVVVTDDYEDAALMANECRAGGIASTSIDMLICAIAARRQWSIFTIDRDFARFAEILPVRLYIE
jgi:predicted nucleic acid-binding protein